MKVLLQFRLKMPLYHCLGDSIRDSGFPVACFRLLASQCSLASPAAGVAARRHPIPELVEVVCQLPFKLIVYSVAPRFAFIRLQASETKFWNAHDSALLKG